MSNLKFNKMKTVNKNQKETIKEVKENFNNVSDEKLLEMDFDNLNEDQIINMLSGNKSLKPKLNTSKGGTKEKMYKVEVTKNLRRKLRKQRNYFIESILIAQEQKDKKKILSIKKEFETFYKETYTKNNYSVESICRINSDKTTLIKAKLFFSIIKKLK